MPLTLADKGERWDLDLSKSLLEEGGGRQLKHLQYYSAIMGRITDYNAGTSGVLLDSVTKKPIRLRIFNASRLAMYLYAYGGNVDSNANPLDRKSTRLNSSP